ncbi:molybdopterin-dependent oxidoreductase [Candidatus Leptofilum sp.]|uniref:molybdopterin-dependent oxidoreductase n=1 Tax=Candidatus Leptofilum sp. TaxID=3241576 RepID=UPI003B59A7BE
MPRKMKATVFRFTNIAILAAVLILTLTGLYSFIWVSGGWIVEIHRIASWALLALLPWKVVISWRSLRRGLGKRPDRNIVVAISLLLATLAIMAVILALLWTWQIGEQTAFGQRLLWWHWILALILLIPFAIHTWRRWPRPKRADFTSRRAALHLLGLGTVGLIGWRLAEALANFRATAVSPRLITGSRQQGAFSGNDFPITSERAPTIDAEKWQLKVSGAVRNKFNLSTTKLSDYTYQETEAVLDCTNGWWTIQNWGGIPLETLLAEAEINEEAIAVRLTSVTGYSQVFTLEEANQILVSTHVGGEPLSHWHGAPARAVVPSRRGTFWVKWLSEIVVLDSIGQILAHPISIR